MQLVIEMMVFFSFLESIILLGLVYGR